MAATSLPSILSQSSLQDFADCARRFELRYIHQLKYPAVETEPALENEKHLQAGIYFHRLVQQSFLGLPAEKLDRLANTPDLARWWSNFLAHRPSLDDYTIYPELSLSAPLAGFRLVAKYDLVAVKEDRAIIYDWKTYRKRPRPEWLAARLQTRVYRALLAEAGGQLNAGSLINPDSIEMVYWFADFPGEPVALAYDRAQWKRDRDALQKLAEQIRAAPEFPLTEDLQKCLFCPYRSYCDRGARAGENELADPDMAADANFDVNFEQIGEIEF